MASVVVGLSGGVDSSVAAYLLKQAGHEVIGIFMKNWHDTDVTISNECPWLQDSIDANLVAESIGIPFHIVDLSKAYKEKVADYMISEYRDGRTPNPDILCNSEIKFKTFMDYAFSLNVDYMATGHYCQKEEVAGVPRLIAGIDNDKDQSYFLCQLTQTQLAKSLFPIGALTKKQVREIAQKQGFITAQKKDSQGLCFVGKVKLTDFLAHYITPKEGDIVEIPNTYYTQSNQPVNNHLDDATLETLSKKHTYQPSDGIVIGKHKGIYYYTIGQRKGLSIGGKQNPLFIIDICATTNTIYVGEGADHPGLHHQVFFTPTASAHWIAGTKPEESQLPVFARIRYRQPLQEATLHFTDKGVYTIFKKPQSAAAPGQFIAWYLRDWLIGSALIN